MLLVRNIGKNKLMLILGQVSYAPQGPKIRKIIFNNPGVINVITRWF